jgi:phosphopantothenoylcysteine decarboxylase/phosphopantothenate--cysteine ligase
VDADLWGPDGHVLHVQLGKDADLIIIAPATANTISKLAHGQSDTLITLAALASDSTTAPLLIAPTMDGGMYDHPATQANLETLRTRGVHIVGPASGHLASGFSGQGRMLEPAELLGWARYWLGRSGALKGRRVVVTAGGTQEPIDPVRTITNRSSGKQGYALAQAALDLGADVALISAPTALAAPVGAKLVNVTTAEEMRSAVLDAAAGVDALLMAAAVSDFRVKKSSAEKIKRAAGAPSIELAENADILLEVSRLKNKPRVLVGFAAESEDLLANAKKKLEAKHLDLIVANDITAPNSGFETDTNRATLLDKNGGKEELPLMSKYEVAQRIMDWIVRQLHLLEPSK